MEDLLHHEEFALREALDFSKTLLTADGSKPGVYFMQEGPPEEGGAIKIGWSKNLDGRKDKLQTGNPRILILRLWLNGPLTMERQFHIFFRSKRIRGEWFKYAGEVKAFLEHVHMRKNKIEFTEPGLE